jgi:amino acid transporter
MTTQSADPVSTGPGSSGPGVFSRQASGLIRVGGTLDVFIFNVGLVSIAIAIAYNQFFGPSLYPGARPAVSTILAGLGMLAVAATFYFWSVVFPRSGGVYVFLSRTVSPGLAFVLSLVETVILLYYAALAASLIVTVGIAPFLATVGTVAKSQTLLDWAASVASHNGVFWIGTAILVVAGLLLTSGTRRYFTTQKVLFLIAIAGTVVLAVLLAFGSRSTFSSHLSSLGGLDYDNVIRTAEANGFVHSGFDLGKSAAFLVWPLLPLLGAVQSVGIGGEVKRVRRSQLWGILGALVSCVLVIALFDLLAGHVFGDVFQGAIAFNSISGIAEGSTESTVGASPYITVLSGILAGNIPLAVVILATFAAWIWFWVPAELAYTTRSMIAWSFDRVAPNRLGYVSERFHTPVVAIWTSTAGAVVFMWLIAYKNIALLTLIEALLVAWGAVMLSAMIFPYRRRSMYAGSPVAGLRWFGLPAMAVTGFLALVFFVIVEVLLWRDPIAAGALIRSPLPREFWIVLGVVVFGGLWYAGMRAYRRRSGIDISLAFQQIPIE